MSGCLKYRVLVLNRLWQPVNIIGPQRAFSLLMQDHAQVIHTGDGSFLLMNAATWFAHSLEQPPAAHEACMRTVKLRIRIPKVLLLRAFDRLPKQEVKFNRDSLFERDGYRCQYCGETFMAEQLNMDHVIPRHHGGRTSWENIVTSCLRCNSKKANRLPHQAGMDLIRRPVRPRWRSFVSTLIEHECDKDWQYFIKNGSLNA
jgi:5-methylcytosine-specific restriction endonuclease McrA